MQHGATLHPLWKIGPQTSAGTKERNEEKAMCRTFSCSVGYNLCSFKCLLQKPNLNVSPLALERNLNQIYCTHVLQLLNHATSTGRVQYSQCPHSQGVCADV